MATEEQNISNAISNSETLQKQHYERIAADYDNHYNDEYSRKYMRRFVLDPMFAGLDLKNKSVLEAMCGGGQLTEYLFNKEAKVTGLDISPQQTVNFKRRHPQASAVCASILNSGFADESFDVCAVVGGIHHLPPHTIESIREIHRVLKPGGYFCFMEPHSETLAESVRRAWYKRDSLFAENEAAVDMKQLNNSFSDSFNFKHEHFLGNFGYLFVLNSMVFRVPLKLKPIYSPSFIAAESVFNKILGKPFSCFVVAQWQKK